MRANLWLASALLITLMPTTVPAQDRMARPGPRPVQPSRPGQPQVRPPRPGNGGPQIQPPRPGPNRPRPPYNGLRPGYHRPPQYRPPAYHYPHGYAHYRRWHIGAILPSILFGSQYYFHDYHAFGLYGPPLHYRWVRYGPDLVLVNVLNGHVRDIHYGAFL